MVVSFTAAILTAVLLLAMVSADIPEKKQEVKQNVMEQKFTEPDDYDYYGRGRGPLYGGYGDRRGNNRYYSFAPPLPDDGNDDYGGRRGRGFGPSFGGSGRNGGYVDSFAPPNPDDDYNYGGRRHGGRGFVVYGGYGRRGQGEGRYGYGGGRPYCCSRSLDGYCVTWCFAKKQH